MEISEAIAALRARPWIVVVFMFVGILGGYLTQDGGVVAYESTGQLNVLPPTNAGGLGQMSADQLDRYGVTQMNVLTSTATAEAVAKKVGGGLTPFEAKSAATFEQIPNSDVIILTAKAATPELAQEIAQGYLDVYLQQAATLLEAQRQPEIDNLDKLLGKVESQLAENDAQIAQAMSRYTSAVGTNNAVPDVASVAPALATKRQLLLTEYDQLTTARGQADYSNQIRTNSFAIQDATEPDEPVASSSKLLLVAGGVVGALLGVLGALLIATLSDSTVTEAAAAATLAVPVAATLPHDRKLALHPDRNLGPLSPEFATAVDQLCVRAMAQTDGPMRIAVAGAQRGAGSTSVSLAMAARYADAGHKVVVIDLDVKDQYLTKVYSQLGDERVSTMIDDISDDVAIERELSLTSNPRIRVLGFGASTSISSVLRQDLLSAIIDIAETDSDIVIFDLGPVLESTVVRHIANMVDTFVLAVSLSNQRGDQLRAVRRILADTSDRLLPVVTSPAKRAAEPSLDTAIGSTAVPSVDEDALDRADSSLTEAADETTPPVTDLSERARRSARSSAATATKTVQKRSNGAAK